MQCWVLFFLLYRQDFYTHSVLHYSTPSWDQQVPGVSSGVVHGLVMMCQEARTVWLEGVGAL